MDAIPQGRDEARVVMHFAEETEGVAATDEDGFSFMDGCHLADWERQSGDVSMWRK